MQPAVDYRQLRPRLLNTDQFKHIKLLIFWPIFGILFTYVERFHPVDKYHPIYSPLDDYIPFLEIFVIPYMFWFIFLIGMLIFTGLYDIVCFEKMMKFIIITYTIALITYFVYPNCQLLRPIAFERDNFLTRFMAGFYKFDTHTNVCPSIHVIGSLAVMFAAWHGKYFRSIAWKISFGIVAVLISVSTVFLKQHSIIDIFAALIVCAFAYYYCFLRPKVKDIK